MTACNDHCYYTLNLPDIRSDKMELGVENKSVDSKLFVNKNCLPLTWILPSYAVDRRVETYFTARQPSHQRLEATTQIQHAPSGRGHQMVSGILLLKRHAVPYRS